MLILDRRYFKRVDAPNGSASFEFWRQLVKSPHKLMHSPSSVLLLRPDAIGDFVIFTRHMAGYRAMFPMAKMDFLGMPEVCALAEATSLFDETIAWDRYQYEERGLYWRMILSQLAKRPYDLVIYPCYSREANGDEMAAIIPAIERWAVRGDDCNLDYETLQHNERFYSRMASVPLQRQHESARNKTILNAFRGNSSLGVETPVRFFTAQDMAVARREFTDVHNPYIVVIPGAQKSYRRWPLKRFAEVVEVLLTRTEVSVVLGGSSKELYLCDLLKKSCQSPGRVHNLAGRIDIRGFAAVIAGAAMLIGNESGPAHIAGSLGVPSWIIVGGGHCGRFFPDPSVASTRVFSSHRPCFGCNWKCRESEYLCITEATIPIEALIHTIRYEEKRRRKKGDANRYLTS